MRAAHRIALNAAKTQMAGAIHALAISMACSVERRSGAMIADVQIHQHVDVVPRGRVRRFVVPARPDRRDPPPPLRRWSRSRAILSGSACGEVSSSPAMPALAISSASALSPRRRRWRPRRSGGGRSPRILRLGMRSKLLPDSFTVLRHQREIAFEGVEVEKQRGSGNFEFGVHRPMLPASA